MLTTIVTMMRLSTRPPLRRCVSQRVVWLPAVRVCVPCACVNRVYCARFVVFMSWQINFVLTQHGKSDIPFGLALVVCILVSTIGLDASLLTGLTRENVLHVTALVRGLFARRATSSADPAATVNERTPLTDPQPCGDVEVPVV